MLEGNLNQAAGLAALAAQGGPRIVAAVAQADTQAEQPLLWQLCCTLCDLGYCVTVLDATTAEDADNPGLAQLLQGSYWQAAQSEDTPGWTVLPAQQGIAKMCEKPDEKQENWATLQALFPHDGVILVYGKAEWLVALLGDSGVEPLLTLSQSKASLLNGYQAFKRLLVQGHLRPAVVDLAPAQGPQADAPHRVSASLHACAKNFLNYEMRTYQVPLGSQGDASGGTLQQLALRLVESALHLKPEHPTFAGAR